MIDDEWVSLREAARLLGLTRYVTMAYGMRGALDSQVVAGRTVISRASISRLAATLREHTARQDTAVA